MKLETFLIYNKITGEGKAIDIVYPDEGEPRIAVTYLTEDDFYARDNQ